MPPKRAANGRYTSKEIQEIREGFLSEFSGFLRIVYKFWRFAPLIILIYLIWKFSGMTQRFIDLLSDFCGCPPPVLCENGGETSNKKDSTFK